MLGETGSEGGPSVALERFVVSKGVCVQAMQLALPILILHASKAASAAGASSSASAGERGQLEKHFVIHASSGTWVTPASLVDD